MDTLHAGRSGITAAELRRTDTKFRMMHICDGPAGQNGDPVLDDTHDPLMLHTAREARYHVGQGDLDVAGLVGAIPRVPLSVEQPNLKELAGRGPLEHTRMCLETAKAYFAAHNVD